MGRKGFQVKYLKLQERHEYLLQRTNSLLPPPPETGKDTVANLLFHQTATHKAYNDLIQLLQETLINMDCNMSLTNIASEVPSKGGTNLDYFTYLPEEMIQLILERITDAKDLISCSNTCSLFQDILLPSKTVWLFPEILPCIAGFLERPEIYKLRQVCRTWKYAVDAEIEKTKLKTTNYNQSYKVVEKLLKRRQILKSVIPHEIYNFENCDSLQRFLDKFSIISSFSSKRNPFVGRSLSLDKFLHIVDPCFNNTHRFLELVGHHVYTCSLEFHAISRSETLITDLCRLCSQLGNVRSLRLVLNGEVTELGLRYSQNVRTLLVEKRMARDPFPKLPHLDSLKLHGMPRLFYIYVFPLICKQLHQLYLDEEDLEGIFTPCNNLELPNLTMLRLGCNNQNVSRLMSLNCPALQCFQITIRASDFINSSHTRSLYEALAHIGVTLRQLHIKVNQSGHEQLPPEHQHLSSLQMNFPLLQVFKSCDWHGSFDILLCMPFLQKVELSLQKYRGEELCKLYMDKQPGEIVEIRGFGHCLYESNVWKLLPFLEEVTFKDFPFKIVPEATIVARMNYSYSRDGYKCYLKAKK